MCPKTSTTILILSLLISSVQIYGRGQRKSLKAGSGPDGMSLRVRDEFLHAWHNYEKFAWGHDALNPLSKTPHDWYGESLYMTPVDALDTLILMGLDKEA